MNPCENSLKTSELIRDQLPCLSFSREKWPDFNSLNFTDILYVCMCISLLLIQTKTLLTLQYVDLSWFRDNVSCWSDNRCNVFNTEISIDHCCLISISWALLPSPFSIRNNTSSFFCHCQTPTQAVEKHGWSVCDIRILHCETSMLPSWRLPEPQDANLAKRNWDGKAVNTMAESDRLRHLSIK